MEKLHSSLMFTSVMSAIGHSTGQVLVVMLFYMQPLIATILPYFLALSIPTGLATGFVAKIAVERVKPLKKTEN
jgi:heptaprenyl diphosphate synthase